MSFAIRFFANSVVLCLALFLGLPADADPEEEWPESPFNFDDGSPCLYPEVTQAHIDMAYDDVEECVPDMRSLSSCLVGNWYMDEASFPNNVRRLTPSDAGISVQQASGTAALQITSDGFVRECFESYQLTTVTRDTGQGPITASINTFSQGTKLRYVVSGHAGHGAETPHGGKCFETLVDTTSTVTETTVLGEKYSVVSPSAEYNFLGTNARVTCHGRTLNITYFPPGEEYLEFRYIRQ